MFAASRTEGSPNIAVTSILRVCPTSRRALRPRVLGPATTCFATFGARSLLSATTSGGPTSFTGRTIWDVWQLRRCAASLYRHERRCQADRGSASRGNRGRRRI